MKKLYSPFALRTAFVVLLMLSFVRGWGQIITFDFIGLAGTETTATSNFNNANLTTSTISRGAGLTASGNGDRFNATSWAVTSIANAVSGNDYMEFTITPNSGYQFDVSSIVIQWQRSGTGNTAISLRSSVDGYASDLGGIKTVTDNTSTQTFTFTFTQANSSSAVTYRLYSYAEATAGTGGPGDGTGNDIVVNGTVTSTAADTTPPTISSLNPVNTATNVAINSNLVATFSENIAKGTGNILIKRYDDNTTAQTIDVTNAAVSISGATATINPADFPNSTQYYVEIDAGAFEDAAGNDFAGITGNSTWSFTTAAPVAPSITSTLTKSTIYGTADSYTIAASGSPTAYSTGALPTGFTFSGNTISKANTVDVGTYNISITATNGGGSDTKTLVWTVTPKGLTVTNLSTSNKVYDGNDTAIISGTPMLNGVVGSDDVSLTGTATGTFADKNVGTGKTVSITGLSLTGAKAGNYSLPTTPNATTTADITAKPLSITAPTIASKVYNGSAVSGAVTVGTLSGFVGTETVTTTATGLYADANAAIGKTATITYVLANGTNGGLATNYSLANGTGTGDITKANPVFTTSVIAINVGGMYTLPGANIATTSDGTLSYIITSGGFATLTGSTIDGVSVGSETLTVNQAASTNYFSGSTTVGVNVTAVVYVDGDYRSIANGNWHGTALNGSVNTWQRHNGTTWVNISNSPPSNSGGLGTGKVYIQNEILLVGTNTAPNVVVLKDGKLTTTISSNFGNLLVKSGGKFYRQSEGSGVSGIFEVENGGSAYIELNHATASSASSSIFAGDEKFHENSNIIITRTRNASNYTPDFSNISLFNGAYFGNLIIDQSAGNSINLLPLSYNGVFTNGNLIFRNSNAIRFSNSSYSATIRGSFIIEDTFTINPVNIFSGSSGTANLIIEGNLIHNGNKNLNLSTTSGGTTNLYLKGNLTIGSTAILLASNSGFANFHFNGNSEQLIDVENTSTASNIAFNVSPGAYAKLASNFKLGAASTFTIKGTSATVKGVFDADDKTLSGTSTNAVTVNNFGLFKTANALGFSGGTTTSLGSNIAVTNLDAGSTVDYYSAADQVVTNGAITSPTGINYQNLEISGTGLKTGATVATGAATGNIIVNQITKINDGAKLHIAETADNVAPNVLRAKGGINVSTATGTELIFKNNANLIQDIDAVNSGSVQAERKASMKRGNYTYWSSPVNGQNLKTFSPGTLDTRFYTYDESDDMFDVIDPLTNDFADNGKGYSIRASNNYTGTTNTYVFTGKFEGTPNNGEKTIAVTKTASGNNLIGNPYLSNIDFRDLVTDNPAVFNGGAEAVAYFWTNLNPNPEMQGTGYPGTGYFNNYATLNMSGGVPATLVVDPDDSSQNSNGETPTYYIKPGQGFIIKVAASGDLTFRNNMRKVGDGSVFFNNNKRAEEQTDRFWISLKSPMGAVTTQLIAYLPNATNGFDGQGYDAKIGTLGADAFYSKIENDKFAIQGRGAFAITDQVDLGTSHYEAGIHSIALGKKEGVFANGQHIYLKDKHTNTITDLSAGDYVFNAVAGNTEDRFEIVYENDLVLGTDNQVRKNLIIYRNGDEFIIKSNDDKITEVELYDSVGRLLITVKPNATEARINVSHLSNAFYVLKIDQNGKVSSKKVIK